METKKYILKSNFFNLRVEKDSYEDLLAKATEIELMYLEPTSFTKYIMISERIGNELKTIYLRYTSVDLDGKAIWKDLLLPTELTVFKIKQNLFDKETFFSVEEFPLLLNTSVGEDSYMDNGLWFSIDRTQMASSTYLAENRNEFFVRGILELENVLQVIWQERLDELKKHADYLIQALNNGTVGFNHLNLNEDTIDYLESMGEGSNHMTHLLFETQAYVNTDKFDIEFYSLFLERKGIEGSIFFEGNTIDDVYQFEEDNRVETTNGILTYNEVEVLRNVIFYTHSQLLTLEQLPADLSEQSLILFFKELARQQVSDIIAKLKEDIQILSKGFSYAYITQKFSK